MKTPSTQLSLFVLLTLSLLNCKKEEAQPDYANYVQINNGTKYELTKGTITNRYGKAGQYPAPNDKFYGRRIDIWLGTNKTSFNANSPGYGSKEVVAITLSDVGSYTPLGDIVGSGSRNFGNSDSIFFFPEYTPGSSKGVGYGCGTCSRGSISISKLANGDYQIQGYGGSTDQVTIFYRGPLAEL